MQKMYKKQQQAQQQPQATEKHLPTFVIFFSSMLKDNSKSSGGQYLYLQFCNINIALNDLKHFGALRRLNTILLKKLYLSNFGVQV